MVELHFDWVTSKLNYFGQRDYSRGDASVEESELCNLQIDLFYMFSDFTTFYTSNMGGKESM